MKSTYQSSWDRSWKISKRIILFFLLGMAVIFTLFLIPAEMYREKKEAQKRASESSSITKIHKTK